MRWLDAVAGSKLAANLAAQKLLRRPEVVGFLVLAGGSKSRRPQVANTSENTNSRSSRQGRRDSNERGWDGGLRRLPRELLSGWLALSRLTWPPSLAVCIGDSDGTHGADVGSWWVAMALPLKCNQGHATSADEIIAETPTPSDQTVVRVEILASP